MQFEVLISLTLVAVPAVANWAPWNSTSQHVCLRYEPEVVAVTGVLTRKVFPGPPNYESIQQGDQEETGFYLEPSSPVCMMGSRNPAKDDNGPIAEVRLIQLVLDSVGYARLRPHLGQQITLRGQLFAAFTGHHHAPLLLAVRPRPFP